MFPKRKIDKKNFFNLLLYKIFVLNLYFNRIIIMYIYKKKCISLNKTFFNTTHVYNMQYIITIMKKIENYNYIKMSSFQN